MRHLLSVLVVAGSLLWALPSAGQSGPANCSVVSQNLWVRDTLNSYYYWYRFLPPTSRVNPASFNSPEAYLEAVRYRPIDNSYSYITSAAANDAFYSDSQVIKYGFTQQVGASDIRVLEVWSGSPAEDAGLQRGDRILQVNGQSVAMLLATGGLGAAFGADVVGTTASIVFEKPDGAQRQAQMTKRIVTIPTVSLTRVVEVDGRRVGYLFFRNFVRPSIEALDEAFLSLREAGATELVLDLRYNGGGLVDVAVHLASLIGGVATSGQVMMTYAHSDRAATLNKTTRFENPAQALNLQRLVAITTRSSASASELVINALRPYVEVVVIGDTTYGKPVGQYGITFCDKVLAAVSFTLRNANDEGDYFDGLAPTCAAPDDWSHQLGDNDEGSFAEALTYIRTGACSAVAEGAARALRSATPAVPRLAGWHALINAQ